MLALKTCLFIYILLCSMFIRMTAEEEVFMKINVMVFKLTNDQLKRTVNANTTRAYLFLSGNWYPQSA